MKKFIFTLALLALPTSTWQVFANGILTVYRGSDTLSGIYYQGEAKGYDGGATARGFSPYVEGRQAKTATSTPR